MPTKVFDRVLQEIRKNPRIDIHFSPNVGEPILAPQFLGKVKALREAGCGEIECTTNGITLHKIGIPEFLEYGPDIINISTAGFDKDMYERIYRVEGYEDMRRNVLSLLQENKKRARRKVVNIWLRGDIELTKQLESPDMKIIKEYADGIGHMEEVDPWSDMITQEMLTGSMKLQARGPKLTKRPCEQLASIAIHPDGGVHACACRNINEEREMYLGNIMETDLQTAYQNLNKVFDKWERGDTPSLCKSCYMYSDPAKRVLGYTVRNVRHAIRRRFSGRHGQVK
jgi:radical SAM protein with 4Fe4S-binding SPASM domain